MVTIRAHLKKRVRIAHGLVLLAMLYFTAVTIAFPLRSGETDWVLAPVFPLLLAGVLYMSLGIRCPRCKGNLASSPAMNPFPAPAKRSFNFCPFCGVSADEKLTDHPK